MLLTPVAAARSASDQSRDSRNARIAAPADSPVTARSGHGPAITQMTSRQPYIRFYLVSLALCAAAIYASDYVSLLTRRPTWHTPAQPTRNYSSATPTTTSVTAPRRRAHTSG